jgi:hypothetical protein
MKFHDWQNTYWEDFEGNRIYILAKVFRGEVISESR